MEEETNMELNEMYEGLGISEKVLKFGTEIEESFKERFKAIDENAEFNQMKVLKAMQEARVSDIHFAATTGYGYNDLGRDILEEVYAKAFHGEDALVRPQLISGTIVVENVFAWPGLGTLCISSIFNRDYPVIQTYVLLIGVLFVVFNLLFDILQTVSDPRMRKEGN